MPRTPWPVQGKATDIVPSVRAIDAARAEKDERESRAARSSLRERDVERADTPVIGRVRSVGEVVALQNRSISRGGESKGRDKSGAGEKCGGQGNLRPEARVMSGVWRIAVFLRGRNQVATGHVRGNIEESGTLGNNQSQNCKLFRFLRGATLAQPRTRCGSGISTGGRSPRSSRIRSSMNRLSNCGRPVTPALR